MKEKILLINPPANQEGGDHYDKAKNPRMGLGYLAGYLSKQGLDCAVIDAKFQGLGFDETIEKTKEIGPSLIGITAMTPEITNAAGLAANIKEELRDVPIVIGGAHVYALPAKTLEEFSCFDFSVFGEGEVTLYELVLALEGKRRMSEINGLVYRENGQIRANKPREFLADLDAFPTPAWGLFPRADTYPILASRGCPFQCVFCMRTTGNRIRNRLPEKVVEEMISVYDEFKPKMFYFHDETFGINKPHTYKLLDLIINSGLNNKISWEATTRVDVADYELFRKMKEAGCSWVGFGIESGNRQILELTQKNITLEQVKTAVSLAKKAGIKTGSFFILGQPYDNKTTMKETINFAVELDTDTLSLGIMVPYPGTKVAEMVARGEGNYRLLSNNWNDYNKQIGNALEMKDTSRKEIERLQLIGYIKFYLYNFRISKIKALFEIVSPKIILANLIRILFRKNKKIQGAA